MTTKTQQAVTAAVDATCSIEDFNPNAVDAFVTAGQERMERKVVNKKRGAKERLAFFKILPKALSKAPTMQKGVMLAVDASFQLSEDSLAWYVQGLAQELFWTYRSQVSRVRRADQQAKALEQSDDSSVSELAAELAGDLGLDHLADEAATERQSYTADDVEAVLVAIHRALSDIYIHLSDTGMSEVPLLTRGSQIATTVGQAEVLAEAIIDQANREQKAVDKEVLRDLASR